MSIISHRHKFIFVRPRKVAGTSILAALSPLCAAGDVIVKPPLDNYFPAVDEDRFAIAPRNVQVFPELRVRGAQCHILPETIRRTAAPGAWDEYFKFTVVRNPWDWLASLYRWKIGGDWPAQKPSIHRARRGFLRSRYRLYRTLPNYLLGRHRQNVEFILKRRWFADLLADQPAFYFLDGRPYADYYIRFEHLQQDFTEVCRLLQLPWRRLPRTKSRLPGSDYRDYYTDWSREHVAGALQQIAAAFGYRF